MLAVVGFLLTMAPEQSRQRAAARVTHVTEVHRVVRVMRRPVEVTRVVAAAGTHARPASAPEVTAPAMDGRAELTPAQQTFPKLVTPS